MHEHGKSDRPVVPAKAPNNAGRPAAEVLEERGLAKGNTDRPTRPGRSAGPGVPSGLDRVREVARRDKNARFTALLHHVTVARLRTAYRAIRPQAAPGVDGVTWQAYGQDLEAKIVQRAVVEVLNAIYEVDFLGFSYGFRPGRKPHDALDALATGITGKKVNWILDADIRDFLDPWSHCSFADFRAQNSWSWGLGSSIRRPFMRPVRVRTAGSSPRFTRCNMVWRETPRARVAWWMATQPSGVSSASMARNSSVSRMRQGAPGVTCSPATKPSLSQRSRVEGAICSSRAAWLTLSSSPSSWPAVGWWQGMCQWVRSEATLLAVNDIPRAVVRCWRLRIPAITASG